MSIPGTTKSVDGASIPYTIPIDPSGAIIRNYDLDVGFGVVPGVRRVSAAGNNPDIDTGPEDIWTGGGLYPWLTTATALEIVSDSAADAADGTGSRTVLINGLTAEFVEVSQTVTLNGLTAVAIPTSLYRVQSAIVVTAGSGRVNAGMLSIRDAGGGTVRGILQAGYGITRQSQFTVPAGYTLSVNHAILCINRPSTARDATLATFIQAENGAYRMTVEVSVDGNAYRHEAVPGIIVPEKTDFGIRCNYVSAANTDLTAVWLGIMRLNTLE